MASARAVFRWAVEPWCTLRMLAIAVKKPLRLDRHAITMMEL
jgi:hypothetical protein